MRRREFLRLAAAAAAAPSLWIPRGARAQSRAHGAVDHVLILFAQGGFRSHATFNADCAFQHNPFGVQESAPGTEWKLGLACGADKINSVAGVLPSFAELTAEVAVIPCVDHTPGSTVPEVDHRTGALRIATGFPDGSNGLLSLVGKHHPRYQGGFSKEAIPPVEIGPSELGYGAGDYTPTRPISLARAGERFGADRPIGQGWKMNARAALDQAFLARRPEAYRPRLEGFLGAKKSAATFAELLIDPRLDVLGSPAATMSGVSNGELIQVLGNSTLDTLGDTSPMPPWGPNVALALRFLAFGSPMAAVTNPIYDMHDNERTSYGPRTRDLVRQLAGLHHLLKRMPHDRGGTYWDRTLVVVMSEFSRNNTLAETGFNSGNGSDHVPDAPLPARNQAVAVMGGPVTAKGKLVGGATSPELAPLGKVYSSRSLLSTLLDVLGVDYSAHWADAPIEELFT